MLIDELGNLAHPLWWALASAVLLVWWAVRRGGDEPVHEVFDKATAEPGQLFADGSQATSKLEQRIRAALEARGLNLYPSSTAIVTLPDERGRTHKYTPDIIVRRPKVIIEVDPEFTHLGKEADDMRRGRCYQDLGYGVVRIRLGHGLSALGPYDVWTPRDDADDEVISRVMSMVRRARPRRI